MTSVMFSFFRYCFNVQNFCPPFSQIDGHCCSFVFDTSPFLKHDYWMFSPLHTDIFNRKRLF